MFRQLVDVLREVFWIKPSRRKSTTKKKTVKKAAPKKKQVALKKTSASTPRPKIAAAKKPVRAQAKIVIDPSLVQVGAITHYFERIKVCVVKVTQGTVLIGDKLTISGPKTKFIQKVWSMQIESEDVKVAKKGQLIGLKVDKIVAVGDKVYK